MGYAKRWAGVNRNMIRRPGTFLTEYRETDGIGHPVAFMLFSYLAVVVPLAVLAVVLNVTDPAGAAVAVLIFLGLGVAFWVMGLVEALLAHGIVYLFGGRGAGKTIEAYAFPTVIRYCLWWFPVVNIAFGLYGLYLQIKGLATFHDISTGKAAVAGILASVLYLLPVIVVFAAVIAAFVLDLGSAVEPQQAMLVLEHAA